VRGDRYQEQIAAKIESIRRSAAHPHPMHRGRYRFIRKELHKRCTHCEEFKSVDNEFYWMPDKNTWRPQCITCYNILHTVKRYGTSDNHGYVPFARVSPFLVELVNRLGKAEAARRMGRSPAKVWRYINHPPKMVQRATATTILEATRAARNNGYEVRHVKSIKHGAGARGHTERVPKEGRDYYRPHGDKGTEYQREVRARRLAD
jgi:hypothetical protein